MRTARAGVCAATEGFDHLAERLEGALSKVAEDGPPLARFNALLNEFLAALATDARSSGIYLAQVHADRRVAARRVALHTQFVGRLEAIFEARTTASRFACEVMVAAIAELSGQALVHGDASTLLALRRPLLLLAERTLC